MATTDTRSGFRLPWSSDRSQETAPEASDDAPATAETAAPEGLAWPSSDLDGRAATNSQAASDDPQPVNEPPEPAMIETPSTPVAPPPPKKPSKLMAELSAAIRATAEAARDQALAQIEADVASVVEQIRAGSKEGEDALRAHADEDIADIKEWSRAEIARIKHETEQKIDARKLGLDEELAAHSAAIEQRVSEVEDTASAYRAEMDAYAERLGEEEDPARLATMAESMPETPVLEGLADVADLELDLGAARITAEPEAAPVLETAPVEAVATDAIEAEAVDAVAEPAEAVAEPAEAAGDEVIDAEGAVETAPEPEPAVEPEPAPDPETATSHASTWGDTDSSWGAPAAPDAVPDPEPAVATAVADPEVDSLADDGSGAWTASAEGPRWAEGETPDGFPAGEQGGEPVDRGAIMAALEAAAEAVVAAESAAESADQAEAAADVAETAAELFKGKKAPDEDLDPEAAAALPARVDAGGFEESYADRLASLLPGHGGASEGGEPRTTQVVVSGLVSVASIASFKRHLGRLAGVEAVAVASGPDGEFVFNVTHRPEVSFRDAVPTMPGFAARVTGTSDGAVTVTARDPEAEG
jgi:hypothetical protein